MRIPTFCICENKDADQLRGNREADQRLCFRYIDSTIPQVSSHLLWLYSPVCVGPGRIPERWFSRDAAQITFQGLKASDLITFSYFVNLYADGHASNIQSLHEFLERIHNLLVLRFCSWEIVR